MDIKTLAVLLLFGHLVSSAFIILVLRKQFKLFKVSIDPSIKVFRRVLFFLSMAILFGNVIPIIVDTATIFDAIVRSSHHVNTVGVFYSAANMITAVLSSLLVWTLYLLAARTLRDNIELGD